MSHTYFMNDTQVTLINLTNGNRVSMHKDDKRFDEFKDLIIAGDYVAAEAMDVKQVVAKFLANSDSGIFGVTIENGVGSVYIAGTKVDDLNNVIVDRIVKMVSDGFSAQPLVNFLENLYGNPAKSAVDELFLFMEQSELPITADGCFIAYKIVREDYMDIYSGKFSNKVGDVCTMPRFKVDDDRNNTCSAGLHFCSKEYLSAYGSSKKGTDRCMLVKINPADVVSIPSDYNNAKGRTCQYKVVGEVTTDEWRKFLADRDYNTASVVNVRGNEFMDPQDVMDDFFYRGDDGILRWQDSNRAVGITHITNKLERYAGMTYDEAIDWYSNESTS